MPGAARFVFVGRDLVSRRPRLALSGAASSFMRFISMVHFLRILLASLDRIGYLFSTVGCVLCSAAVIVIRTRRHPVATNRVPERYYYYMNKQLLLGDEAIAQAALDAGISGAYAYPGTPSTEILEYIQNSAAAAERNIHHEWSANEKTAMEEALGMAYSGHRALVAMKHVGLNVAADPFINAAVTGVNGGLVVIVVDDPSMHSSQNEQDSRFYARFAGVPMFEPANQQESYDMVRQGYDLSEEIKLPVVIRITTRLAHSRADIMPGAPRPANAVSFPKDRRQFILLPANARRNYEALLDKQVQLKAMAEISMYNRLVPGSDRQLGIIACGITINYLNECYAGAACPHPVLMIGQYPLPFGRIATFIRECDTLLILEEGAPFLEEYLCGPVPAPIPVNGRMNGTLPRSGELTPESVARALGRPMTVSTAVSSMVKTRPPMLCNACPHTDTYLFLGEVMRDNPQGRVFSDIGCYTLGALPPFEAIETCVDMGASITMAKGAADAGVHPAIAVIGDSTFTHSGMTGLLDAAFEKTNMTVLILDNGTTGMTGGQTSMGSGRMEAIAQGLGVDPAHIRTVVPMKKNHAANVAALRSEVAFKGLSVIICQRNCVLVARGG